MKKSKLMHLLYIGIIAVLPIISLTGCSEEEMQVDYSIEGITEAQQSESVGGKTGLVQFEGEENWKETWTAKVGEFEWNGELLDIKADMKANAKVIVPQTKQMSVVEVAEPEFDAEFKKTVAENIFASGEIYYRDPSHLPKKDLQEIQEYLDEIGDLTIKWEIYPYSIKQLKQKLEDVQAALDNMESAKETYTPVEEYTVDEYLGIYEERMYRLTFAERPGDGLTEYRRFKQIKMEVKDLYEVCPEEFKDQKDLECSPWMQGNWVENQCELSEEDALKKAQAFVEQMGLDYPVFSFSYPLLWGEPPKYVTEESSTEGWGIDGYVFTFDLGLDDISFVNYGMEEDYRIFENPIVETDSTKEIRYSLNARMQIYVTDRGVIKVIADNPMELVSVSEGVALLPLYTIKSIIKDEMNEQWELFNGKYGGNQYYDTMELIYFRVSDKEHADKYSYVPVWRLAMVTKYAVTNEISIEDPVLINAIDGTVINFYEET